MQRLFHVVQIGGYALCHVIDSLIINNPCFHGFSGLTSRLDYLVDLGVDAVWLGPVFRSPHKDHGYDVSDYTDIDPVYGSMEDFDQLITTMHQKGKYSWKLLLNATRWSNELIMLMANSMQ